MESRQKSDANFHRELLEISGRKTTFNRPGWAGGSGYAGPSSAYNHNKFNKNLGLTDDPPTKALFEFVDEALKK